MDGSEPFEAFALTSFAAAASALAAASAAIDAGSAALLARDGPGLAHPRQSAALPVSGAAVVGAEPPMTSPILTTSTPPPGRPFRSSPRSAVWVPPLVRRSAIPRSPRPALRAASTTRTTRWRAAARRGGGRCRPLRAAARPPRGERRWQGTRARSFGAWTTRMWPPPRDAANPRRPSCRAVRVAICLNRENILRPGSVLGRAAWHAWCLERNS